MSTGSVASSHPAGNAADRHIAKRLVEIRPSRVPLGGRYYQNEVPVRRTMGTVDGHLSYMPLDGCWQPKGATKGHTVEGPLEFRLGRVPLDGCCQPWEAPERHTVEGSLDICLNHVPLDGCWQPRGASGVGTSRFGYRPGWSQKAGSAGRWVRLESIVATEGRS